MGAFLTAAEADGFWGCGTRSLRSLKQSSPFPKNHWRRLPKSLMRINEPINEAMGLVLAWIFNLKQFKYVYRTVPIALWQTKIVYNKFTSAIDTVMDLYNLGLFYKIWLILKFQASKPVSQ